MPALANAFFKSPGLVLKSGLTKYFMKYFSAARPPGSRPVRRNACGAAADVKRDLRPGLAERRRVRDDGSGQLRPSPSPGQRSSGTGNAFRSVQER
jgi:hypothetical protein